MPQLQFGVNDVPSWTATIFYAFQQAMVCAPGLILTPQIVTEVMCAGSSSIMLKTQLISASFVAAGMGTVLQSTFGLRLAMMHGPAAAFLPPLIAYGKRINCTKGPSDFVEEEEYMDLMREVSGSLLISCLTFLFIGFTGVAGHLSRLIGPITIIPVMLLLVCSLLNMMEELMSDHWVSIIAFILVAGMVFYLENVSIPIPRYGKIELFGQYPLVIALALSWFLCYVLTLTDVIPFESKARTDRNATVTAIHNADWIKIPYPGQLRGFKINIGLTLAFCSAVLVDLVENLGSYDLLSRVSNQKRAPKDAINRAVIMEGLGSLIAASMGVGSGLTTYSSNIALIEVTRVASRRTMQVAGIMLILFGIFPKCASFLASIPDPVIAGVVVMVLGMVLGVTFSNLQVVDLNLPRNVSIIGTAVVLGNLVPIHFTKTPVNFGNRELDDTLNMLLTINMLIGGLVAVILDNTVPGATKIQRGLKTLPNEEDPEFDVDGYAFPKYITKACSRIPLVRCLPFMPKTAPIKDCSNQRPISMNGWTNKK